MKVSKKRDSTLQTTLPQSSKLSRSITKTQNKENIRVAIRFRPLNRREIESDNSLADRFQLNITPSSIDIKKSIGAGTNEIHKFSFDHVFNEASQEDVFAKVASDAVDSVVEGYNSTIFAYGVTSSGKTFTMFGTNDQPGVVPRACRRLFGQLYEMKHVKTFVKCSFIEIYCETIRDLLNNNVKGARIGNLRIRQDAEKGIYIEDLTEKFVNSPDEILQLIHDGTLQRSTASTLLNDVSSRSHAVLCLTVSKILEDGSETNSKLYLVDLAGSENVGKSMVQGVSLTEAQMINKSLSSLGNVIYALTEKGRDHIPYRDSRLTYLLQDSLGGNSKTILIVTATPHSSAYSETLNSLRFGKRAKEIKNKPKVNRNESNANLRKTIDSLTIQLSDLRSRYEESQTVIKKIENMKDAGNGGKKNVILQARCERLQTTMDSLKTQQVIDNERYQQCKEIFEKQRKLAQDTALNLYGERNRNYVLYNDLEQYKLLYQSLLDSVEYPNMLKKIVREWRFRSLHDGESDSGGNPLTNSPLIDICMDI